MSLKPKIKVGDRFETNNCGWCAVVEYHSYSNIVVKFDEPEGIKVTTGANLKRGQVMNPSSPRSKGSECEDIEDVFLYDESSPSCLRWKVNRYSGKDYLTALVTAGDEVGTLHKGESGTYYQTRFNGKRELCHRLVWRLVNGEIPKGMIIDHKDGNSLNNRISNLRLIDAPLNPRNAKKRVDNLTGVTGVKLQENTDRKGRPYYYFIAFWKVAGKDKTKCFSISKFGNAEAFRLACEYRARMIDELNQQGAGYSERHGT